MRALITLALLLYCATAHTQNLDQPRFSTMVATFGTTVVVPGGLTGKLYLLDEGTLFLPNFDKFRREPVGTIYTRQLWVPPREFSEGFPGVTDRFEWFAIDYTGRFYVSEPGNYRFSIESDDGSKLYIDHKLVINADGLGWLGGKAKVTLDRGIHTIRVSYMQGPRYHLYLMLSVIKPGGSRPHPFNTDDFRPPTDLAEWTTPIPDDLAAPVRRRLAGPIGTAEPVSPSQPPRPILRPSEPVVPLAVRVLSGGRPVLGLTAADFVVRDRNEPQIVNGASFDSEPLDIQLLLDVSPSVAGVVSDFAGVLNGPLRKLRRGDRIGVFQFAEGLREILPLTPSRSSLELALRKPDRTPSGDRLKAVLEKNPELQEALRSSTDAKEINTPIAVLAQLMPQRARTGARRAIIVLTDNTGVQGVSARATHDALWRYNVIVCGLLLDEGPRPSGTGDIRPLVQATGGEIFPVSGSRIPIGEAFDSIRGRYVLTYRPPAGEPKTIHLVSVELASAARMRYPEAQILVRGGYVVGEEGEIPHIAEAPPDRK